MILLPILEYNNCKNKIKKMDELKIEYPIYATKILTIARRPYLLLSGGGGTSASGVKNQLQLFELTNKTKIPQSVVVVSTDDTDSNGKIVKRNDAPMNMAVLNDNLVAVGLGHKTQIYKIEYEEPPEDGVGTSSAGRIRKRNNVGQENNKKSKSINLIRMAEISDDSMANADCCPATRVAFTGTSSLITGGTNVDIKIYNYIQSHGDPLKLLTSQKYEIPLSHSKEIRDLSIHKNLIASISEDKQCHIWSISNDSFEKIWSLREQFFFEHKISIEPSKINDYSFMCAKWFETSRKNLYLITCSSPVQSRSTIPGSYICLWKYDSNNSQSKFTLMNSRNLKNEVGSAKISSRAIYVENERQLVAVGFTTGHVMVYSMPDFAPVFKYEPADLRKSGVVTNVAIVKSFVISTSYDNCIRVIDFDQNYSEFWRNNGRFLKIIFLMILIASLRVLMVIYM